MPETSIQQMKVAQGIAEDLKARDQMAWRSELTSLPTMGKTEWV